MRGFACRFCAALVVALVVGPAGADDFVGLRNGTDYYSGFIPYFFPYLSADGTTIAGVTSLTSGGATQLFVWSDGVFTPIDTLDPDGIGPTQLAGISADGGAIAGSSPVGTVQRAFRWTADTGVVDLGTLGGDRASANAISSDGSTVVGNSVTDEDEVHAFRWHDGAMDDLGMQGDGSSAEKVSADGSVVAGYGNTNTGLTSIFRWTQGSGMIDIGNLSNQALTLGALSADGSTIVGTTYRSYPVDDYLSSMNGSATQHAFRWTADTDMVDLGTLGGHYSEAQFVSADGSVVAGRSYTEHDVEDHAFRWEDGVMTDLGTLGGSHSEVSALSSDGRTVVGGSYREGASTLTAYRWTEDTGMLAIADLLSDGGVDIEGWELSNAVQVSADGSVIVGFGKDLDDSTYGVWITHCATICAILDSDDYGASVAGLGLMGRTGNALTGMTLGAMADQAGSAHGVTAFAYGAYDTDPTASATAGFTAEAGPRVVIGASFSVANVVTDLPLGGSSNLNGGTAGAFVAGAPGDALQWLIGLSAGALTGTVDRNYHNGNSVVTSSGETTGLSYGATARLGWRAAVGDLATLTPYASYTLANIDYDGWTETGGPFPAEISAFKATSQTLRAGIDASFSLAAADLTLGLSYVYRLDDGGNGSISASLPGITDFTVAGSTGAGQWVEVSGGVKVPLAPGVVVAANLTALVPDAGAVSYQSRAGISVAF
jgi:probable HAF family extracellular repeat protein